MRWVLGLILTIGIARADCTVPGAMNPEVTQDTISSTICVAGWTKTVRPASSWTNRLKHKLLPKGRAMDDFELDHCVPLELGGAPASLDNLWLQPWAGPCGAHVKDALENQLHREVCTGRATLEEAREAVQHWCEEEP